MSTPAPLSPSVLAPKPHYAALDGLRGVAAVMVVLFHMFEGSARDFQFTRTRSSTTAICPWTSSSCCPASSSGMPMTTAGER